MKARYRAAAASLLALAVLTSCSDENTRRVAVERSWPAAGVRRLGVHGINGRIEVDAGVAERIEMHASVRLPRGSREKADELIRSSMQGPTLQVGAKHARRRSAMIPFLHPRIPTVDYRFRVPASMMVDLNTVNGRIEIKRLEGSSRAESVNGNIEIATPSGQVSAQTVNGRIRTTFTEAFRGARLETVNGSITIAVPKDASIDCDIVQVNGSFHSEIPVAVNSGSARRSTNASINGGRYPLDVTTVNGSIRLVTSDE